MFEPMHAWFLDFGTLGLFVWTLLKVLVVTVPLILAVAFYTLFERKVIGWIQPTPKIEPTNCGP